MGIFTLDEIRNISDDAMMRRAAACIREGRIRDVRMEPVVVRIPPGAVSVFTGRKSDCMRDGVEIRGRGGGHRRTGALNW